MSWTRLRMFPLIGLALAAEVLAGAQPQPERVEPSVLIKKDNDNWINKVQFTADGRYLLTSSTSPKSLPWQRKLPNGLGTHSTASLALVKIWELPAGNLVRILEVHHGDLSDWATSDVGGLLATGSEAENTVKIWEIPSGRLVRTLDDVNYPRRFFAEGTRLWASHRGSFSIGKEGVKFQPFDDWAAYDVATGAVIAKSEWMLLSSNARIGAVVLKDGLEIRNAPTGDVVRQLAVPFTPRRAFSPDGSRLAVGHGSEDAATVAVWNTQTGARVWTDSSKRPPDEPLPSKHVMHVAGVPELVFSPDGATLIGWDGGDAAVRVWDAETGRQRSIGHSNPDRKMQVRHVAFNADGSLLAIRRSSELKSDTNPTAMPRGKSIGTVTFVRMSTLESVGEITLPSDARGSEMARDLSYVATLERDGTVRIWRAPSLAR